MIVYGIILSLIGGVVLAGGGLSLIVYQIFKYLTTRWLDAKFDEKLQELKHRHNQEIERLRFRITGLLDRTTKLHQREFDVLPESWSKLNEAFRLARATVSNIQTYPDFPRMNASEQEAFIAQSVLTDWQKNELRDAVDKNRYYIEKISWHALRKAQEKARTAYSHTMVNGIFIDDTVREKFDVIHDLIWKALLERDINLQYSPASKLHADTENLNKTGEVLMKELEVAIHKRIWPVDEIAIV